MARILRALRGRRGSVLLLVTVLLALMFMIGGFATDFAQQVSARNQLQRSLDAAALAGASQLAFDDSVFGAARLEARRLAGLNPYRGGGVDLALNVPNARDGAIVLGIWDPAARPPFTPSLDGSRVNAVTCRYETTIPTFFLRMLGRNSLPLAGEAIAVANPPKSVPGCLFPIGVSQCPFQVSGNFGTEGCGQPVATVSPSTTNTAAWVNLGGSGTPSASATRAALRAAAQGACLASDLRAGQDVGAQNGTDQPVWDDLSRCNPANGTDCAGFFNTKFAGSPIYTVRDGDGQITYQGKGWEVYVPVIRTDCPAGPITQDHRVLTFSRIVITQVINRGWCAVANHEPGNLWDGVCPAPNGTATSRDSSLRAVYGYFECAVFESDPIPDPGPPSARATRARLVK